jgi:hypothetical protein
MTLKLKALLEGYAWERRADGSLPTLRDAIAVHEANSGAKPDFLDLDGDGNEKESMKSAAGSADSTKYGNYINKARAKSHLTKKDGTVYVHAGKVATKLNSTSDVDNPKYTKFTVKSESVNAYKDATRNELASHISQLSTELRNETDPRKQRIIKQDLEDAKKQLEDKKKSVNEYGENDFDRSSQFYGGGKSSRESNGDVSEIVEKLEDHVDRLMQDLSTNSNVSTSEKSVILKQLVKIADLIDELQDNI